MDAGRHFVGGEGMKAVRRIDAAEGKSRAF